MSDGRPQSALREVRAEIFRRNVAIALIAIGILLGLSGPFGTLRALSLPARTLYWLVVVFATFCAGAYVQALVARATAGWRLLPRLALGSLAIGLAVSTIMAAIQYAVFGAVARGLPDAVEFFGTILFIAVVVNTTLTLVWPAGARPDDPAPAPAPPGPPAILSRLPPVKRGDLISMSVSDHYVEVATTRGTELVLMRLSDAIELAAPVEGLRIHRSHWVALGQVARVARVRDRAVVTLRDGRELPASRSNLPALRTAGLLT